MEEDYVSVEKYDAVQSELNAADQRLAEQAASHQKYRVVVEGEFADYERQIATLAAERDALARRVAGLEEAMKFYADPESWVETHVSDDPDGPVFNVPALMDGGDIASAALAAKEVGDGK